ncbi:MAG: nucleoside monophosphate kinase [Flavobacteriales bacterium]
MKELDILFLDFGLSNKNIASTLSSELNLSAFSLVRGLTEQSRINNDLGSEIQRYFDNGEMLTTELIGRFISKYIKSVEGNILLSEYPRNLEQFDGLKKVLKNDQIKLKNIWYFKQRDPLQFMEDHYSNPNRKVWVDKFGLKFVKNGKQNIITGKNSSLRYKRLQTKLNGKQLKWIMLKN